MGQPYVKTMGGFRGLSSTCVAWHDKGMRAGSLNIWGPYRDAHNKFRLKISENGQTRSICFRTYDEADMAKARLRDDIASQQVYTIGEAVRQFCEHLAETRGIKPESVAWTGAQLEWLPQDAALSSINQERAEKLYRELVSAPRIRAPASRCRAQRITGGWGWRGDCTSLRSSTTCAGPTRLRR
jgi:hypothetical protein